uniref:Sdh4 n=1 Tax=Moramonas marocensis TaxID=1805496 RepID=A0A140F2M3_9EUKA|nr:sdh4 [Moramonas marocensis]
MSITNLTIKNTFSKIHQSQSTHWSINIFLSILSVPLFLYIFIGPLLNYSSYAKETGINHIDYLELILSQNSILLALSVVFMVIHIQSGIESVVEDYIHGEKIKAISKILLRILTIEVIKTIYLFFITLA